ncbi:MAG: hypothetical protein ACRD6W_02515 [Nitrososphaerales archaeon]
MRRIGPIGTWSRVVLGAALVFFGLFHGHPWGIPWYQAVLGLVGFPSLILTLGLVVGHYTSRPLRLTGAVPTMLNCGLIVAFIATPYTGGAIDLFYGVTLLTAAWRGQPGCEATVISNWILRRDDQIGCPVFSPIDHAERRQARGPATTPGSDPPPGVGPDLNTHGCACTGRIISEVP